MPNDTLRDTAAVREFMDAFDQPVRTVPTTDIPDAERLLRARLVFEEALEFVEAMGCTVVTDDHDVVTKDRSTVIIDPETGIDLVEATDALADITVVTKGSAWTLGVPVDAVFDVVHGTNMAKLDPTTGKPLKRADGKVVKPDGWLPPTPMIADLLRAHGWKG